MGMNLSGPKALDAAWQRHKDSNLRDADVGQSMGLGGLTAA
jgi:hypothetical protein